MSAERKTLPREPTVAMLRIIEEHAVCGQIMSGCHLGAIWRAMWDAADVTPMIEAGVSTTIARPALHGTDRWCAMWENTPPVRANEPCPYCHGTRDAHTSAAPDASASVLTEDERLHVEYLRQCRLDKSVALIDRLARELGELDALAGQYLDERNVAQAELALARELLALWLAEPTIFSKDSNLCRDSRAFLARAGGK